MMMMLRSIFVPVLVTSIIIIKTTEIPKSDSLAISGNSGNTIGRCG